MLKERRSAVEAVRTAFLAAERAQDSAAVEASRCLTAALEARRDANLPIGTGLKAIGLLARSATLAIEARQALIEAHPEFAAIPAQIGLGTVSWGDEPGDCPPTEPRGEDRSPLRVVAAA
jgi:hypothetical protein